MSKRIFLSAIASAAFILPLQSQTDYEYAITRHKGNKIVLLGAANANDAGKWKQIIDSDGVYGHGFMILDRELMTNPREFDGLPKNITDDFESWFRQRYGLSARARWAALDMENNLIVSGIQTPSTKEFEQMLDQRGIKSPLRQVRDFLGENPDHIDAMTDLLTEARRSALHVMPPDTTEDLDTEADLRTWGVLAAEMDRVFNSDWLGVDIFFFRLDQQPPERFSKLMKAALRKHITKVESAIRLDPANETLWNIWAWMARSLSDYKWGIFIDSIDTFNFPDIYQHLFSPSGEICIWLVEEAMAKGEWETVVKYARTARSIYGLERPAAYGLEWVPGSKRIYKGDGFSLIPGHPQKTSYLPHLEALLRLGRIDEANELYDELIRLDSMPVRSIAAADHAANIAKSVGMKEIADIYGQGRPISNAPWLLPRKAPYFFSNTLNYDSEYYKQFDELIKQLAPRIDFQPANSHYGKDIDSLGWKKDDGPRWALIASDGRVMAQDSNIPALDEMQTLYSRFGIENGIESCKKYLAAHSSLPGLEMQLVYSIVLENINALRGNQNAAPLDDSRDDALWGDATRYLRKVLAEHPEILVNLNTEIWYDGVSIQSQLLRAVSKLMLANIESLLSRKPSSDALWMQWLFWKEVEGSERSIEPLVERIKLSPITQVGIVPPAIVIDTYYEDCKKSGSWGKVVGLLKTAWDREFSRTDAKMGYVWWGDINKDSLGDKLGIYLIEAYLHDNKPGEANEIFNSVLGVGGKFTDISKIVELAKEKGQDRLAREWGEKVKK